ncbi:MAG TPA: SusC/RagA family TonB-linked outer membrane protein [Longimicrobiales bacterium]
MSPRQPTRVALAVLLAVVFGGVAAPAHAQQAGRVLGAVTASGTGAPLVGVQVYIQGTDVGTITNEQGQFLLLNVPAGTHTLRVELIGYQSASREITLTAGQSVTVDFALSETAVALDEIVVTGTAAVARRKEIGNSVATVSAADIEAAPVTNPQDILAGRAAGVTFMQNSGQPGAGGTIRIRGTNTVSLDSEPLIYVDGIRIFNEPTRNGWGGRTLTSPLQDINAEDIARIEVIKGAAATTLYGTEAANGVINIITKKGFAGAPSWSAEITTGVNASGRWGPEGDPTNLFINCGAVENLYGIDFEDGSKVMFEDPTCPEDGDWIEKGVIQQMSLSVRGGSEAVTYFLSGHFGNNEGVLPTQYSKDGGMRANVTFRPFDGLDVAVNTAYTRRNSRWAGDGNNSEGFLLNVGRGWRGYLKGGKGDECDAIVAADKVCVSNAYVFDQRLYTRSDHFTTGLTLTYAPIEGLTNRFSVGWDYLDMNNETTLPFGFLGLEEGYFWDEDTRHTTLSLDYAGSYQNTFGSSISSTFSWGGQIFRDYHRWTEMDVQRFAGRTQPTWETGSEITYIADAPFYETNAGFFFQETVGWNDRLFVTAGLRVDGNSAFGERFGLQPYPKLNMAYTISEHDFWPEWWETMKLRAAVGESGKAPGPFDKIRSWSAVTGDEDQPGVTPQNIGNEDLGPERIREIEFGFDASLFAGRLGIEATAFEARTFDALIPVQYPPSEGFLAARMENVGELVNRGVEFLLTAGLVRTDNIDWRIRSNVSFLENEAVDLGGKEIYTGLNSYVKEGFPIGAYWNDKVMNPDAIGVAPDVQDTIIGPVYPTRLVGVGTTLTLMNNLTLDALFEHQGGHYVQNYTGYQNARRGVWYPCYDAQQEMVRQKLAAEEAGVDFDGVYDGLSALTVARCNIDGDHDEGFWTEKGDFIKLRHISLSYELPPSLLGFANSASLTLSARNLFTWTDYTGTDPENQDVSDQFGTLGNAGDLGRRDYYQIPAMRTFTASLRFSF